MQPVSDIFLGWQPTDKPPNGKAHNRPSRRPPVGGTGNSRWTSMLMRPSETTASCAPGRWPVPTLNRATRSPSRPTSATLTFDQAIAWFADRLRRSDRTRPPGTGERSPNRTRHLPTQRHVTRCRHFCPHVYRSILPPPVARARFDHGTKQPPSRPTGGARCGPLGTRGSNALQAAITPLTE